MDNRFKAEGKKVFAMDPEKVRLYRCIENNICTTGSFRLYKESNNGVDGRSFFYSLGIHDLCKADPEFIFVRETLIRRLLSGDIGAEDEWDSARGRQYSIDHGKFLGCYRTEYGPVEVKFEDWFPVIYLPFER